MEFPLSRYRNLTVLLLVIFAQLVLLAYQVKTNQDVRLIRVWAVTAVTPLAHLIEGGRSSTVGFLRDYVLLFDARQESLRLKEELGKLKLENQFLKTELSTADRAQALNAFQSRTPSRTIAARIIGTGTGTNSKVVFVDRGSSDGILKGMAVVTPDGIVGKVLAVYPTASQVLLITDPSFAAGVISQKNHVHGTLKGQGHSTCMVDYVQNEEQVEVGELFYTSGDDRVFPKGLPVGIANVVRTGKTFKDIYIVPSGFQGGLEEVLIVLEGVHQQIPAVQAAAQTTQILPPPPKEAGQAEPGTGLPAVGINTEADRMRDQYKRIGESQGHVFGAAGGAPNFNVKPKAPAPTPVPSTTPSTSTAPATRPVAPPPPPPPSVQP